MISRLEARQEAKQISPAASEGAVEVVTDFILLAHRNERAARELWERLQAEAFDRADIRRMVADALGALPTLN